MRRGNEATAEGVDVLLVRRGRTTGRNRSLALAPNTGRELALFLSDDNLEGLPVELDAARGLGRELQAHVGVARLADL